MNEPGAPNGPGRMSPLVFAPLLVLFIISNFLTFILSAIVAGDINRKSGPKHITRGIKDESHRHTIVMDQDNRVRFTSPFIIMSIFCFFACVFTSLVLMMVFQRGRQDPPGSSMPRYVLRVISLITIVLSIVLAFGWTEPAAFTAVPIFSNGGLCHATTIIAHINVLFGVLLTWLSASLDIPRPNGRPTGTDTRRGSGV
ncbi:hypothetical protein F66182_2970 [Fusarium sp. NRRL 66182]|nr:hypothetical protein F66182_2970 [Fusarium sp. NRRL 66182]